MIKIHSLLNSIYGGNFEGLGKGNNVKSRQIDILFWGQTKPIKIFSVFDFTFDFTRNQSLKVMNLSFLPKCQPKILRISALPSNKLPGQKSLKFLVGILGETMTS